METVCLIIALALMATAILWAVLIHNGRLNDHEDE